MSLQEKQTSASETCQGNSRARVHEVLEYSVHGRLNDCQFANLCWKNLRERIREDGITVCWENYCPFIPMAFRYLLPRNIHSIIFVSTDCNFLGLDIYLEKNNKRNPHCSVRSIHKFMLQN